LTDSRAKTPDYIEELVEDVYQPVIDPVSPPNIESDAQGTDGRHKSFAALRPFEPSTVLARLSAPMSQKTADIASHIGGHYAVPEGEPEPGVESGEYRTRLKRKADVMSRSQYEVYSFSTKHDLSEAATDELLEMLSNVSITLASSTQRTVIMNSFIRIMHYYYILPSRSDLIPPAFDTRP